MALASVTREQFEIRSEVEVVHIPTGGEFRAYPYSNFDDMLQSVKVSWGRAGAPAGDYAEQVRSTASQLMLERAHQLSRGGRFLRNAAREYFDLLKHERTGLANNPKGGTFVNGDDH